MVLDELAAVIIQTVRHLPAEVRTFVYDECLFVQGWLRVVQRTAKTYTIIIPETFAPDDSDDSLIAHSIAATWLQHQQPLDSSGYRVPWTMADAVRAAELVRSWGFTGGGANVEQYRRDATRYGPTTIIM